jgi:hypothetical protein
MSRSSTLSLTIMFPHLIPASISVLPTQATCLIHLIFLHLTILTIYCEYWAWSFSLSYFLQLPATSFVLALNVLYSWTCLVFVLLSLWEIKFKPIKYNSQKGKYEYLCRFQMKLFFPVYVEKYQNCEKINVWGFLNRSVNSMLANFCTVTEHKVT